MELAGFTNGRTPRRVESETLLIRIAECDGGWPVSLHLDDGSEGWLNVPIARDVIPAELPPAPGPRFGEGDVPAAIRRFVLAERNESGDFERIGNYLHGLLHRGAIGAKWDEVAAAARPRGLRLLLDLPGALGSLPWELICSGMQRPATDVDGPLVRVGHRFPGAAAMSRVRWPLKVLVVVGSPENDRIVAAEDELRNLNGAFRRKCGQVDVELLRQPTRAEVREKYRELRPHIFHFIGHGDVHDGRGRLMLHDPASGEDQPWTATAIGQDLHGWQPRLAILNACRSADLEDQDGAWRVADAFEELGASAVIAMQADIRGDAAAAFTGALYTALVEHEPLDVAVSRGRLAITDMTGFDRRDFAVPSLTVSAPPESVLSMCFGVSQEHLRNVQLLHRGFPGFVDRALERRRLWRELDPESDDPHPGVEPASAVAIMGPAKVGKSELARWCVGACELHGGNAAYVDLSRGHRLESLATLQIIAETLGRSPVYGERNRRAFASWSESARSLRETAAGGGPPPAADAIANTFVFFGDALRDAAAKRPLLIALDELGSLPDEELSLLCDCLLEPIARAKHESVRLMLALSDEQGDRLTDGLRQAIASSIALKTFKPDDFTYIAGQYLRYHFDVTPKKVEEELARLPVIDRFSWQTVRSLGDLVQSFGWERFHDHA